MVYGNTGDKSGSGVAFTRDPATGEKVFYGEFLINAQGEDVVAGVRTPEPVAQLKQQMPRAYAELEEIRKTLESHFKDVQDFEFTIEDGEVFMLQTRNGKRTGLAAVRCAIEMEKEKLIDWRTAIRRFALGRRFLLFQVAHALLHLLAGLEGYDVLLRHEDFLAGSRVACLPGLPFLHLEDAEVA